MGFGPGAWGGGPSSVQANAAAGLPFAGVPGPLQEAVEKVLETEPTFPDPVITFDRANFDRRPFTLGPFKVTPYLSDHRRNIYNTKRPHGSLGWKAPAAYAANWRPNCQHDSHNDRTDKRGPFTRFPLPSICHRDD